MPDPFNLTAEAQPTEIVSDSDPRGRYEFDVSDGLVRVDTRPTDARDGRKIPQGEHGFFVKDDRTESIYAYAPDTDAKIEVSRSRFELHFYPSVEARDVSSVDTPIDIVSDVTTVTTSAGNLPSEPIYDSERVQWTIRAAPTNDGLIAIGNDNSQDQVLGPGDSVVVDVDDISELEAKSKSGTQSLTLQAEALSDATASTPPS